MITSYGLTDVGSREVNEDSFIILEEEKGRCYVLCDGLGGHGKGEVASKLVTEVLDNLYHEDNCELDNEFIPNALSMAQSVLLSEQIARKATNEMKTTATVVTINNNMINMGYIGDSRIYVFQKNKVKRRTLDHSVPQMLALAHEIKEKNIRNHPDRNRLLKVMGIEWERPMYQMQPQISTEECQAILMCSDGFWELIDEKQMCKLLKKSSSVKEWIEAMALVVKENGKDKKMDNNTAIGIWVN